jgi:cysteine desulfuration protein SufE
VDFCFGKLIFCGASDSLVVSGLIGLLLRVYNFSFPYDIIASNTKFINEMSLHQYLTSIRNNGLHEMLCYIYSTSQKYINY